MSHGTQTRDVPDASPNAEWYRKFLQDMRARYPSLVHLGRLLEDPWYNPKYPVNRKCRVRMIDLPHSEESGREFETIKDLNDHLKEVEAAPRSKRCRVYVVENLTLEYIAAFGYHFNVDPTVFARQVRTANWEDHPEQNNTPKLLLRSDPKHSFSLRYSELRLFKERVADLELLDCSAGRVITVTTSASHLYKFHHVGIVRRSISFWCKERPNNDGGEGIDIHVK